MAHALSLFPSPLHFFPLIFEILSFLGPELLCGILHKKMALGKSLLTVSTLTMMMLMVVFALPLHPCLTRSQGGRKLVEDAAVTTTEQDIKVFLDKGASSSSKVVVEDSAREVPTGPDPLHHNTRPIRP